MSAMPALRAQDAQPAAPAPDATAPSAPAKEEKTDLEKQMDSINRAFRTLRRQIADATKNDSSLQLVQTMHDAADAASKLTPKKAADLAEADRPQFESEFQAGIKDLMGALDKLTTDLKANDNTAAADDVKQIQTLEGQNHKKFKKQEKQNN
jgi:soluble cytochrome b562